MLFRRPEEREAQAGRGGHSPDLVANSLLRMPLMKQNSAPPRDYALVSALPGQAHRERPPQVKASCRVLSANPEAGPARHEPGRLHRNGL